MFAQFFFLSLFRISVCSSIAVNIFVYFLCARLDDLIPFFLAIRFFGMLYIVHNFGIFASNKYNSEGKDNSNHLKERMLAVGS